MSDRLLRESDVLRIAFQLPLVVNSAFADAVKAIPSADRPPGEWIDKGDYAVCSNCGAHSGTQFDGVEPIPLKTNFCPNCGADMRSKIVGKHADFMMIDEALSERSRR